MVEETNFKGKNVFKCMKCGWMYEDRKWAEKCEEYCKKYHACSLEIAKHAIKMKGGNSN